MSPYQRDYPVPPRTRTVHFVGDTHITGGMSARRRKILFSDLDRLDEFRCIPRAHVGDMTEKGFASEDTDAVGFMNLMNPGWQAVVGNHDIWDNARNAAAAASAWGRTANWTLDAGFCVLIGVSPTLLGADNASLTLDASYLASALDANAGKVCLVVAHPPLQNTVLEEAGQDHWNSLDPGFYAVNDTAIRDVLATRPQAKAWVSGHTHSPLSAPNIVKRELVKTGAHHLAAINASSPFYTTKGNPLWTDTVSTCYVTVGEGAIEVRYRDHGAHRWTTTVRVPF